MSLPELATRRPVATLMIFLAVMLMGVVSVSRLSVDLLPDLSYPVFAVRTNCPNTAPEEVENLVTRPIEEAVAGVPGVLSLSSTSGDGLSLVTATFSWGSNMDFAALNVREKLDQLRWLLPENAGRPTIVRLDPAAEPIIVLAVGGADIYPTTQFAENILKRRLEQVDGVALAAVTGGVQREIHVEVNKQTLLALHISLDDVARALEESNYSFPGGAIRKGRYRYALRTLGEFTSLKDIESVVVSRRENGALITLGRTAKVKDGFKEAEGLNRLNGEQAVGVLLIKEAGANTVAVAGRVAAVLKQIRDEYPEVHISEIANQANFISLAIRNVVQAMLYGGLLAVLVLFVFLRDARLPLVIAVSIPVSILAAFLLFYKFGVQLNIMSLGGLALGIGLLVDNSIVVLENIFRLREDGLDIRKAATQGAAEVGMPLLASTLTTVAVFLPIAYIRGVAGQLFRDQAFAVTWSLLASLPTALTLMPVLTVWLARQRRHAQDQRRGLSFLLPAALGRPARKTESLFSFVTGRVQSYFSRALPAYENLLERALNRPGRTLLFTALVFLITLAAALGIHREFMPAAASREMTIDLSLPRGASLEWTSETAAGLEQMLFGDKDVVSVFAQIGKARYGAELAMSDAGSERARLRVRLNERGTQERLYRRILREWRRPAGCEIAFAARESMISRLYRMQTGDIRITVSGPDLDELPRILNAVRERTDGIAGVVESWTPAVKGTPELQLRVDRRQTGLYGLSVEKIVRAIRQNVQGVVATQFNEFDRKTDILLRPAHGGKIDIEQALDVRLVVSDTLSVPLRALVSAKLDRGPGRIERRNQTRQLNLTIDVSGRPPGRVIADLRRRCADIGLPPGYEIRFGGVNEEMKRSFRELLLALGLAIALVYMILAAQFESLRRPFVIILSIPMALVGVVWALLLTGSSLNVLSFIGVIVLAGVAVNDAIIKISFINQRRNEGAGLRAAVVEAGRMRFRPIVMTSVTTILGLTPLALSFGPGGMLGRPLAIAIIGGLFTSTALTLIIVPVLYFSLERKRS